MDRLPLEERLSRIRSGSAGGYFPPDACRLYLDAYFRTLSEMSGDPCYNGFYDKAASDGVYGDISENFIFRAAGEAASGSFPEDSAMELLYQMLVKPFADKRILKPKGGKKK